MAPHATSPSHDLSPSHPPPSTSLDSLTSGANHSHRTPIPPTSPSELHDLITIGFGPAALAIAVALHDSLDSSSPSHSTPKVAFLERQSHFAWHAGMQLPGARMQISWLKDLATLRNPRSSFTFLNYLHDVGRLISFTNLGTFLPLRREYEEYMRWCAGWFDGLVSYGHEGVSVVPEYEVQDGGMGGGKVKAWVVTSRDVRTGETQVRRTRHVVLATGGAPAIPEHLPQHHPRVLHSSRYLTSVGSVLPDRGAPYTVLVVGSGQSAAEIFTDLHTRYPRSKTRLMIRHAALKPSDDSPFVNEVFDPNRVDDFFEMEQDVRSDDIAADRGTNYGVVRLTLLEKMYDALYEQRLDEPDEKRWMHRILPFREVVEVREAGKKVKAIVRNEEARHHKGCHDVLMEEVEADLVIVAAGYAHDTHEQILKESRHLMAGGDREGKKWQVNRDYSVKFAQGAVADDSAIWLQGCNESSHGLADTLLSILATRGGEMVDAIFGGKKATNGQNGVAGQNGRAHMTGNGVANGYHHT